MFCLSCASRNQVKFGAEMNIHFSGYKNIDKPSVWLFPEVWVCMDCGCSQFRVPTAELTVLSGDDEKTAGSAIPLRPRGVTSPTGQP